MAAGGVAAADPADLGESPPYCLLPLFAPVRSIKATKLCMLDCGQRCRQRHWFHLYSRYGVRCMELCLPAQLECPLLLLHPPFAAGVAPQAVPHPRHCQRAAGPGATEGPQGEEAQRSAKAPACLLCQGACVSAPPSRHAAQACRRHHEHPSPSAAPPPFRRWCCKVSWCRILGYASPHTTSRCRCCTRPAYPTRGRPDRLAPTTLAGTAGKLSCPLFLIYSRPKQAVAQTKQCPCSGRQT